MYTEQDLEAIRAQKKRRWWGLAVPAAICLVVVIVSVAMRQQLLTDVATILLGVILIAGYDLLIKPLRCYERHLNDILHGRTHELTDCMFDHLDEEVSVVDGVSYYGMTVICEEEPGKPYDRLFYYDAQKPRPNLTKGTPLRLIYHDRELGLVEPV